MSVHGVYCRSQVRGHAASCFKVRASIVLEYLCLFHVHNYTVHSTLYTLHSTLYTLHCTLYTLHSTLCTIHTIYIIHYTINLHCILCRDDRVEPLEPPADSKPGDRVFVDGYQHETAGGMCSVILDIA